MFRLSKDTLKLFIIPLTLLALYISMQLLWKVGGLPPPDELTALAGEYIQSYGLWVIFVSALLEGFLILGQYFPGGFVIFFGVIAARGDVLSIVALMGTVSIAFLLAYYLNYLLGKYGWYKLLLKFGLKGPLDRAQEKVAKHTLAAVLGSYWEPNLASFTATAAGVLQIPLLKFMSASLLGVVLWNTFWSVVVYFIGESLLENQVPVFVGIISVWCLLIVGKILLNKKITVT